MKSILNKACVAAALALLPASAAQAQNIDLGAGGADLIWHGTAAGANAGKWLDQGPLSAGDNRRDLVIGSPGSAGVSGKVYVIYSGAIPSGDVSLNNAHVIVNGPSAGDGFGTSTAVGPVIVHSTNLTSNLVVGAPGALGGRGAVYVFATPMNNGTFNAADAIYRIEGATGDRIGASLATADINNDGYREIVIGAPGTSRVYVLAGGPALSGVKNLNTSSADLVINGPGIGDRLQAGDVTGDGVFEILVGSPTANAVYLLTGGYPAVSNLPADADAVFTGIDAGDAVGASLRIGDLDADGRRDIIIGAPGADGPSNSRTNAGEAYVLWGRPTFSSMNLANADVVFQGATAHNALGEGISAGDINRDTPNDVVFLVIGNTPAGELLVYYGRERSAFGVAGPGGTRIVDFASVAASRRIIGDPASGTIATSQVYEVTGEGARDVIVGVPSDDSNRGEVLFTISPRMIANPNSITLSMQTGTQTNRAMVLENASTVPISWTASADQPWLSPQPSSGTSVEGNYASLTLYISAQNLLPGTYTGHVTFTSTTEHLEMGRIVDVNLTVTPPVCTYDISPASAGVSSAAGSRLVTVTTQFGCAWSAAPNAGSSFLTIPNGTGRTGSGTVTVNVAANGSTTPRTGTATIAGSTFTVNQAGVSTATILRERENARADFNNDDSSDLLVQNLSTGALAAWTLSGHTVTGSQPFSHSVADNNWRIVGSGDFNADGNPDVVWHHQTEGWVFLWYMNGTTRIGTTYFSRDRVNPGWKIAGVGDFNADGRPDIVWHHQMEGRIAFWLLNGITVLSTHEMPIQFIDKQWQISAVGDFNGDGDTDLLLRHLGHGEIGVWLMDGTTRRTYVTLTPGAIANQAWQVAAIIDANGDTKPDIIWHHSTEGSLAIWYMDGTVRTSNPSFTVSLPAGMRIGGPK